MELADSWMETVGVAVAIVIAAFGAYRAWSAKTYKPQLDFYVQKQDVFFPNETSPEIKMWIDGEFGDFLSSPSMYTFEIKLEPGSRFGKDEIRPEDIDYPITIAFGDDSCVKHSSLIYANPNHLRRILQVGHSAREITIEQPLLRVGDSFSVQTIVDRASDLGLEYRIHGLRGPRLRPEKSASEVEQIRADARTAARERFVRVVTVILGAWLVLYLFNDEMALSIAAAIGQLLSQIMAALVEVLVLIVEQLPSGVDPT